MLEEKYSWKPGTQFSVDAKVAADTIRALQMKLGKDSITAQELLDNSRDPDSPLHSCFEWDDSVAAEKYRRWQAAHVINSITVTIKEDTMEPITTRLFINVQPVAPKKQGEFVGVNVVFNNPDYRNQVLSNALIELRNFQRKYQAYEELRGVFKAIDSFVDTVK